ncbi:hypothetical protein [Streptomyces sp. NPDC050535]
MADAGAVERVAVPPGIEANESDETPPGSGTWIVRSGTATIRDLVEW